MGGDGNLTSLAIGRGECHSSQGPRGVFVGLKEGLGGWRRGRYR